MPFHKVFFRLFPVLITVFFSFSLSSVRLLSETPFSLNSRQKRGLTLRFPAKMWSIALGYFVCDISQWLTYRWWTVTTTMRGCDPIGQHQGLLRDNISYLSQSYNAKFLFLCSDICSAFGAQVHPYLEKQAINELLQEGRRSKTHKTKQVATWATKELRKLKQQQVSYIVIWFFRNSQV